MTFRPAGPYSASKAAVQSASRLPYILARYLAHTNTALSETLAVELSEFSIRVLIVEPAAFRTEVLSSPFYTANPIPDYDTLRKRTIAAIDAARDRQKGDPAKAMEVLVDVVRDEGKAHGRPWPLYLMLGAEAEKSVNEKCEKVMGVMKAWRDMTTNLDFDEV